MKAPNAQLRVSARVLKDLLDLPSSYSIVGAVTNVLDGQRGEIRLLVQSDSLPAIGPTEAIPELLVRYELFTRHLARLSEIRIGAHWTSVVPPDEGGLLR